MTKQSGTIYIAECELKNNIQAFCQKYIYMNLKDREQMNSIRQMEAEVVEMTKGLLNGGDQVCGVVTQGGTESIFQAIYAYRQKARSLHQITKPNIVICKSAHVAFDKACFYLDIEVRKVGQDDEYKADIEQMAR